MTDIQVGDEAFDKAFVVKGDEPARVQALLGHAPLRDALQRVHASRWVFSLRDHGFRVEQSGLSADAKWLEWALRSAAEVVRLMGEATTSVPCASPLAPHRDAWARLAESTGMQWTQTPLCVHGRHEGASICASAFRNGTLQYGLDVFVRFDRSLGLGLLVRPHGAMDALASLFGGQDIKVGDSRFDEKFVVKAGQGGAAEVVLDSDVRATMVELVDGAGAVRLDDEGVTLREARFPSDPSRVPELVAKARSLATRISDNVVRLGARREGIYR
jgi:hypothetical protein